MVIDPPAGMPEVRGIFTGGCVARGDGSSFRRMAHAHNGTGDPNFGWICVRAARRVFTAGGNPSTLLLHEYAHILCPDHGHDPMWRRAITRLGRPAEANRYIRKPRMMLLEVTEHGYRPVGIPLTSKDG